MRNFYFLIILLFGNKLYCQENEDYSVYYCEDIITETDKFTKKITKYSPLLEDIGFTKVGGKIYISLYAKGETLNVNERGVKIILKDGSIINKPNLNIDVTYNSGYRYSVFFPLNKLEIQKIIKNPITDFRLFIYDNTVSNPDKFSYYLKCLL
jgi:hypothetical protein